MAKKMKLDTTKLKQFVLEKGERVGLAVTGVVMVLFVAYGLMLGLRASSPADDIKNAANALRDKIDRAKPPPIETPADPTGKPIDVSPPKNLGEWKWRDDLFVSAGGWFDPGASGESKRQNPGVLPVGEIMADGKGVKNIDLKYVLGGVPMLDYHPTREDLATLILSGTGPAMPRGGPQRLGAGGGDDEFVHLLHPTRLVLVHASFPLKEQLEVMRKALRMNNVTELLAAGAGPRFLGLNVYRVEILPNGQAGEPKAIYETDDKGHSVAVGPETKLLLTTGEYDDKATDLVLAYLVPGLATPVPKFLTGAYPKPELAGIDFKGGEGDGTDKTDVPMRPQPGGPRPRSAMPGGRPVGVLPGQAAAPGGANDEGPTMREGKRLPITKLADKNPALFDKIKGDFNQFNAYGEALDDDAGNPVAPMPNAPPRTARLHRFGAGTNAASNPADEKHPDKYLVRFFDADVQPGKTYRYSIQVRMANPNFGKKLEVAYNRLAEVKEIPSPEVFTPDITIPLEYFAYAVDIAANHLESKKAKGPKGTETDQVTPDKTAAIQILRWVDKMDEKEDGVADWIIAERLLIHRGEELARLAVEVELPVWNKLRAPGGQFELASSGSTSRGKKGGQTRQVAAVNFFPRERARTSVLVDFEGGKRTHEDASSELLVLRPDGKLVVQTSRDDTENGERNGRYEAWRSRISSLRPTNTQGNNNFGRPNVPVASPP